MGTAGQVRTVALYGEWEWEQSVYKMLSPVSGVMSLSRIINLRHTRALLGLKWPLAISSLIYNEIKCVQQYTNSIACIVCKCANIV